jgi:hypothetical protein
MKHPGIIYKTDKNEFAIAYNKEQRNEFEALNKVLVHVFVDEHCTQPKYDEEGKKVVVLKSVDKLSMIGFND